MAENDIDAFGGRRDTVIIVNPAAHNLPKRKRLQEAGRWLEERGWSVEWRETSGPREATGLAARAAERGALLLFVCGGDGTLNEAANGLAGSETALAMIPAGTVNIWAKETRLPRRPLEAVQAAIEGERRQVDLGKAGERYFLLMAGYGLDGAIARRLSKGMKGRLGATAYAIAAVRESLSYRGSRLTLRLDGEERQAEVLMLVAGNTRNYAGVVEVTPEARADDGLLDICVYEGRGTADIVLHVARTLLRRHRRSRKVTYRQVRRLEMGWERPLPVQLDGDLYEESPAEVTVAPAALWVMLPRGVSLPLFSR
ncbi:MAG: diacylglycerol kinase family lipid kinase [Chloroflexi bacterium]|nr:diacylglycerol kinase family lipid kinase [Chloroflexota bacterium]